MKSNNEFTELNLILADDDLDDCLFFQEALEELQLQTKLTTVHNGDQLMQLLKEKSDKLPDVLFLDLNMPRKNGFACLEEIKRDKNFKQLPVIILSTSFDERIADLHYKNGAHHYICKPADFSHFKKVIHKALTLVNQGHGERDTLSGVEEQNTQPSREEFVLRVLKATSI